MNAGDCEHVEELVVVYRAQEEYIAEIIRGILEDAGIPVLVKSHMVTMYDGILKPDVGYWGDVLVPSKFAERSRIVIAAYNENNIDDNVSGDNEMSQNDSKAE